MGVRHNLYLYPPYLKSYCNVLLWGHYDRGHKEGRLYACKHHRQPNSYLQRHYCKHSIKESLKDPDFSAGWAFDLHQVYLKSFHQGKTTENAGSNWHPPKVTSLCLLNYQAHETNSYSILSSGVLTFLFLPYLSKETHTKPAHTHTHTLWPASLHMIIYSIFMLSVIAQLLPSVAAEGMISS